jgi:Xaa-Pro aminopeptidase
MPHARPTDRKIREGELIKFDFGSLYLGYCSDTTRTIKFGNVTDPKLNEI